MARKDRKKERRERAKARTQQRREQRKRSGRNYLKSSEGSINYLSVETNMKLDFIPFPTDDNNDDLYYTKDFKIHKNVGPEDATIVCPKSVGKPCPICEEVSRLAKEWDKNKNEIIAISAKDRNLYNVIDLNNEDKGIQLWDMSYKLFEEYLQSELDEYSEDDDERFFWELEDGKTLKIRFSKEALGDGHYFETKRIDFEDRDDNYDEEILEDAYNLNDVLVILDYNTVEALFLGIPNSDSQTNEDESNSTEDERKKSSLSKKRKKKEDEDENNDDDNDGNDKRKEEKSRPLKKRKKKEDEKEEKKGEKRREKKVDDEDEDKDEDGSEKENDDGPKKCPYDHEFGTDLNHHDECDTCDNWDACYDQKDELKKQGKKKRKNKK